jgi:hypothetical protein
MTSHSKISELKCDASNKVKDGNKGSDKIAQFAKMTEIQSLNDNLQAR